MRYIWGPRPGFALEEMSSVAEALRLQLDTLQREQQQLEAENARLRAEHPDQAALEDATAERDRLREENESLGGEARQLRTLYDRLLKDSQEECRRRSEYCPPVNNVPPGQYSLVNIVPLQ